LEINIFLKILISGVPRVFTAAGIKKITALQNNNNNFNKKFDLQAFLSKSAVDSIIPKSP